MITDVLKVLNGNERNDRSAMDYTDCMQECQLVCLFVCLFGFALVTWKSWLSKEHNVYCQDDCGN